MMHVTLLCFIYLESKMCKNCLYSDYLTEPCGPGFETFRKNKCQIYLNVSGINEFAGDAETCKSVGLYYSK